MDSVSTSSATDYGRYPPFPMPASHPRHIPQSVHDRALLESMKGIHSNTQTERLGRPTTAGWEGARLGKRSSSAPRPSTDPSQPKSKPPRDSLHTTTSSSLYPPSTSSGESPPSSESILTPASLAMNTHLADHTDDVAFRLQLLVKNNYYLPPAHAKPVLKKVPSLPNSHARVLDPAHAPPSAMRKSALSPNLNNIAGLFRKAKKAPSLPDFSPSYPSPRSPLFPSGENDRMGMGYVVGTRRGSASRPATPRVVVVREPLPDIQQAVIESEAREDLRRKHQPFTSRSLPDHGSYGYFDIDPTDVVDVDPALSHQPSNLSASAMATKVPPTPDVSSLFRSEEGGSDSAWRRALLEEAVGLSMSMTMSNGNSHDNSISNSMGPEQNVLPPASPRPWNASLTSSPVSRARAKLHPDSHPRARSMEGDSSPSRFARSEQSSRWRSSEQERETTDMDKGEPDSEYHGSKSNSASMDGSGDVSFVTAPMHTPSPRQAVPRLVSHPPTPRRKRDLGQRIISEVASGSASDAAGPASLSSSGPLSRSSSPHSISHFRPPPSPNAMRLHIPGSPGPSLSSARSPSTSPLATSFKTARGHSYPSPSSPHSPSNPYSHSYYQETVRPPTPPPPRDSFSIHTIPLTPAPRRAHSNTLPSSFGATPFGDNGEWPIAKFSPSLVVDDDGEGSHAWSRRSDGRYKEAEVRSTPSMDTLSSESVYSVADSGLEHEQDEYYRHDDHAPSISATTSSPPSERFVQPNRNSFGTFGPGRRSSGFSSFPDNASRAHSMRGPSSHSPLLGMSSPLARSTVQVNEDGLLERDARVNPPQSSVAFFDQVEAQALLDEEEDSETETVDMIEEALQGPQTRLNPLNVGLQVPRSAPEPSILSTPSLLPSGGKSSPISTTSALSTAHDDIYVDDTAVHVSSDVEGNAAASSPRASFGSDRPEHASSPLYFTNQSKASLSSSSASTSTPYNSFDRHRPVTNTPITPRKSFFNRNKSKSPSRGGKGKSHGFMPVNPDAIPNDVFEQLKYTSAASIPLPPSLASSSIASGSGSASATNSLTTARFYSVGSNNLSETNVATLSMSHVSLASSNSGRHGKDQTEKIASWREVQESSQPADVRRLDGMVALHLEAEKERMKQISSGITGGSRR